jgi:hypothetical protein
MPDPALETSPGDELVVAAWSLLQPSATQTTLLIAKQVKTCFILSSFYW